MYETSINNAYTSMSQDCFMLANNDYDDDYCSTITPIFFENNAFYIVISRSKDTTGEIFTPHSLKNLWYRDSSIQIEPIVNIESNNIYSISEQINLVRDTLALNMSELAKILKVTRPTVYAWLEGQQEPKHEALRQIQYLSDIAKEIDSLKIIRIDTLIHRPLFNGCSFFDKICEGENVLDSLYVLKELADKEAKIRIQSKNSSKHHRAPRDVTADYSTPIYPKKS